MRFHLTSVPNRSPHRWVLVKITKTQRKQEQNWEMEDQEKEGHNNTSEREGGLGGLR